jgi:hypothetical protein
VCLFDHCLTEEKQYKTIEEWEAHMRHSHALSYCCKVPGHEHFVYDSPALLQHHLITDHAEEYQDQELADILQRSFMPSLDIFATFNSQNQPTGGLDPTLCTLCEKSTTSELKPAGSHTPLQPRTNLTNHVASHLESLALLSLPYDEDMESQPASEHSEAAATTFHQRAAREDLLPVRPPGIFEDTRYQQLVANGAEDTDVKDLTTERCHVCKELEPDDACLFCLGSGKVDYLAMWTVVIEKIASDSIDFYRERTDLTLMAFRAKYKWRSAIKAVIRENRVHHMLEQLRTTGIKPSSKELSLRHPQARQKWYRAFLEIRRRGFNLASHPEFIHKSCDVTSASSLIRNWLQYCVQNHPLCNTAIPELPTRLIYVGSDSESPRLHISQQGERGQFTFLAYLWGQTSFLNLVTSNYADMSRSIELNSFPRIFQDAMALTRQVGIQYLWIDSLCIIQDSQKDWQREASMMSHIYTHATVTFAAVGARSTDCSLFTQLTSQKHYRGLNFGQEPWRCRAWTFQEEKLSTRLVTFESAELAWRCKQSTRCECIPWQDYQESEKSVQELYDAWRFEVVQPYSGRTLTYMSDRLSALSAMACHYAQKIETQAGVAPSYICGIWAKDLLKSLCWFVSPTSTTNSRSMEQYVAPSWSWASIAGPVEFAAVPNHKGWFNAITAWEAQCHPLGPDVYGQVSSATVVLEAHILEAQLNMRWMHRSNIEPNVEISLPTSEGSKSVLHIDDCIPTGRRAWRPEGKAYVYPDRDITDQDIANLRFIPFNKPIEDFLGDETIWTCSDCGDGPMLVATHPGCINCGHEKCVHCTVQDTVQEIRDDSRFLHGLLVLAEGAGSTYRRVGYLTQTHHPDNITFAHVNFGKLEKIIMI